MSPELAPLKAQLNIIMIRPCFLESHRRKVSGAAILVYAYTNRARLVKKKNGSHPLFGKHVDDRSSLQLPIFPLPSHFPLSFFFFADAVNSVIHKKEEKREQRYRSPFQEFAMQAEMLARNTNAKN